MLNGMNAGGSFILLVGILAVVQETKVIPPIA